MFVAKSPLLSNDSKLSAMCSELDSLIPFNIFIKGLSKKLYYRLIVRYNVFSGFKRFIFEGDFLFNILYPRIRTMREAYGLTQKEIAKFLDIDQRVYSTYELGKREIPVHFVIKLAKRYHVSTDYLLGLKNRPEE